jgi:hypothetical protein
MTQQTHIKGTCPHCGAETIGLRHPMNSSMVWVNSADVGEDDKFFNWRKHVSHFRTCDKMPRSQRRRKTKIIEERESAEDIIRDREKLAREFAETLRNDKRPFIVNNKLPISQGRYALLNCCSEAGLDYESLLSWNFSELLEWWGEKGSVIEAAKKNQEALF